MAIKWICGGRSILQIYLDDNGTPHDILTLDGDNGTVIVEDGKLEVKDANANGIIEVSGGGANNDAQIEFGDNGSANDAIIGWESASGELRMTPGTSLTTGGVNIIGSGTNSKIGLGTSNNTGARVLISSNSGTGASPTPQLLIEENNNSDFARLQFGNFGVDEYWHVAATSEDDGGGADPRMTIFYWDGGVGTNVMVIDGDDNNVGIDRTPTANDLEVNGTASKTAAGDWLANSDRRIKTDILDIENSFETMLALHPVKFKYSEDWMKRNPSLKDQYYYNFIAQEYQEIFPEAVQGSGEYLEGDPTEILQIDTYNAQIVNMVATQDLIRENKVMKGEVASLKAALDQMTRESHDLKSEFQIIKSMLNQVDFSKAAKPTDD
ncbi:MAG: tail fiber domain-containing protein [Saprospiraceae bacterium]|nr:tail fiber domain-containing protein [Saprospiraceae bacterium]